MEEAGWGWAVFAAAGGVLAGVDGDGIAFCSPPAGSRGSVGGMVVKIDS
jgi:hypothetical protein